MAVKIELSFQGSCKNPRSFKSAANGLLSGFWCLWRRESFVEFNKRVACGTFGKNPGRQKDEADEAQVK